LQESMHTNNWYNRTSTFLVVDRKDRTDAGDLGVGAMPVENCLFRVTRDGSSPLKQEGILLHGRCCRLDVVFWGT
jgi:hypothetical protein